MKYLIGKCAFGHFGIIFKTIETDSKAVEILLPRKKGENIAKIKELFPDAKPGESPEMTELSDLILEFFEGTAVEIPMAYVDTSICYPFQLQVLHTERTIPRGKTASYSWVAKQIGTRAFRAVGSALARNPFPIVVPCHRAVRSDRTLGGFQGGLGMKRRILEMEGVAFDSSGRVVPHEIMLP
ncbi:MAG: methylated-DNA--[protein]-cysteine S-methyltransferase [Candidatus Thorarchaeota archaeon]